MQYELLIYASDSTLIALNINGQKKEYISMDGNTSCNATEITSFHEYILDYYNVDELSEMEISVQIINAGISEKNLRFLNDKFAKLGEYDIWSIKKLIPIVLLEQNSIEKNGNLVAKVYDKSYRVQTDDQFFFTVEPSGNEPTMLLTLENFTVLNHFDGKHFHGDEEEMKYIKDRLDQITSERDRYEHDLDETTKDYEQKLLDSKTQYDDLWAKHTEISRDYDLLKAEVTKTVHEYKGIHVIRFDSNLLTGTRKDNGTKYSCRVIYEYETEVRKKQKILTFEESPCSDSLSGLSDSIARCFSGIITGSEQEHTGRSYKVKAEYKGKLIKLMNNYDEVKDGDAVAILVEI